MALIIRRRQVAADNWFLLRPAGGTGALEQVPAGDVIIPARLWVAHRDALLVRSGRLGVWLDAGDDPQEIAGDLAHFTLIAVDFPQFTDGRGYSMARLLRERYGWRGQLRAVGDVLRDQLYYLSRCGFDAFELRAGQDPHAAIAALDDFSDGYQTSVEQPLPLFRRRPEPVQIDRDAG